MLEQKRAGGTRNKDDFQIPSPYCLEMFGCASPNESKGLHRLDI